MIKWNDIFCFPNDVVGTTVKADHTRRAKKPPDLIAPNAL